MEQVNHPDAARNPLKNNKFQSNHTTGPLPQTTPLIPPPNGKLEETGGMTPTPGALNNHPDQLSFLDRHHL